MIRSLLARQARRHATVLLCLGTAFMLLGAPGAGAAVEIPAPGKQAAAVIQPVAGTTSGRSTTTGAAPTQAASLHAPEPVPEPRTSVLLALGLAATAFMARRRN